MTQSVDKLLPKLTNNRLMKTLALSLPLSFFIIPAAQGFTVSFTKIADTNTSIPGTNENFSSFGAGSAVLDDNTVAFIGSGNNSHGIYISTSSQLLEPVVDTNTVIPYQTNKFTGFGLGFLSQGYNVGALGLSGNKVVFNGYGQTGNGIYTGTASGVVTLIANKTTQNPTNLSNFTTFSFSNPDIDQETVAFWGEDATVNRGLYRRTDSNSLSLIADNKTLVPSNNSKTFAGLFNPSLEGETVAFNGFLESEEEKGGIYIGTSPTSLSVVVDTNTFIPKGVENFTEFGAPALDEQTVAFRGRGINAQEGIYLGTNSNFLSVVADTNTFIPNGIGNFINFGNPAFDENIVAFWGKGNQAQQGIYVGFNGLLYKIIDLNQSLDGKTLSSLDFASNFFNTSNRGLSKNSLVFLAAFTDGSQGIYKASFQAEGVVEPSTQGGIATAIIFVVLFKARQQLS
ncbi:hypothetical protein [Gloeothece verrucosa]|uniref:Uncharacterized protein n=1 Tax=Gloeothece verrucosa (strain PCC 7822) TaxID=497965 RepID=E0UKU3_GLOV7|nr:hypothetical protein [Gloeothece verrucosa]ADN17573.1 hypothetical protein Cyan7822_5712 [Gloeothece verrucosa PCC 7822]